MVRLEISQAIIEWIAKRCLAGGSPGNQAEALVAETILSPATQCLFDDDGPAPTQLRAELVQNGASGSIVRFLKVL